MCKPWRRERVAAGEKPFPECGVEREFNSSVAHVRSAAEARNREGRDGKREDVGVDDFVVNFRIEERQLLVEPFSRDQSAG